MDVTIILKALSNPSRILILRELMTCRDCINGELVAKLPLSQATVSQHLEILRKANLVTARREGTRTSYCINHEMFPVQLNGLMSFAENLVRSSRAMKTKP
jgi:DNA-binding transcriptional ArsR family regulator